MNATTISKLLRVVASAMWGMNGGYDWSEQIAFLQSEVGAAYYAKLERLQIQLMHMSAALPECPQKYNCTLANTLDRNLDATCKVLPTLLVGVNRLLPNQSLW